MKAFLCYGELVKNSIIKFKAGQRIQPLSIQSPTKTSAAEAKKQNSNLMCRLSGLVQSLSRNSELYNWNGIITSESRNCFKTQNQVNTTSISWTKLLWWMNWRQWLSVSLSLLTWNDIDFYITSLSRSQGCSPCDEQNFWKHIE